MKKSNKRYLFVFIIIIALSAIFFIIYGMDSNKKQKMDPTIIIDNDAVFRKVGSRWIKLDKSEDLDSISWNKFNIYTDTKYFGKYYIVNQDKWYLFDNDNNAVNYEGSFIGIDTDHNYKVINIIQNDITDYSYVEKALSENEINTDIELSSSNVISLDIDNNGKNEYIYTITNRFSEKKENEKYFGLIFMVKNNRIYPIYKNSSKEDDIYDGCKPYVNSILDIDQDNKYEVIVSCAYYSNSGVEERLYKFDNANFNLLVSNYE